MCCKHGIDVLALRMYLVTRAVENAWDFTRDAPLLMMLRDRKASGTAIYGEASYADSLALQEKNRKNGENLRRMCPKYVRVASRGCTNYQSLDVLLMLLWFTFWTLAEHCHGAGMVKFVRPAREHTAHTAPYIIYSTSEHLFASWTVGIDIPLWNRSDQGATKLSPQYV